MLPCILCWLWQRGGCGKIISASFEDWLFQTTTFGHKVVHLRDPNGLWGGDLEQDSHSVPYRKCLIMKWKLCFLARKVMYQLPTVTLSLQISCSCVTPVNDQCHRVFVVDYQLVQSMLEEKIAKLPPDSKSPSHMIPRLSSTALFNDNRSSVSAKGRPVQLWHLNDLQSRVLLRPNQRGLCESAKGCVCAATDWPPL